MTRRLRQLIAAWFVLQIVLPFTAPLQTLDWHDLFGETHSHSSPSPESSTTPTIRDTVSRSTFAPQLDCDKLETSASVVLCCDRRTARPITSFKIPISAQSDRHSVLRL